MNILYRAMESNLATSTNQYYEAKQQSQRNTLSPPRVYEGDKLLILSVENIRNIGSNL